jgi:hypothetical protein
MKYEILQDTPDIVKGTVGTLNNDRYVFPTREGYEFKTRHYSKADVENNKEWFKPVPETPIYNDDEWIGLACYSPKYVIEEKIIGIGRVKNVVNGIITFTEVYFYKDTKINAEDYTWAINYTCKINRETVEKFLIQEAKRRGFKEGIKIDRRKLPVSLCFQTVEYITRINGLNKEFEYIPINNFMTSEKNRDTLGIWGKYIYAKGQWAEIVAEIVKEEEIVVNGYKLEVTGSRLSFGCAHFDIDQFKHILYFNDKIYYSLDNQLNRKIKSVTLESGITIDIETIKRIVEKGEKDGK